MKPEIYGVVSELYAWVAFLIIFLTFGMETAFFRFSNLEGSDIKKIFQASFSTVIGINVLFLLFILIGLQPIASALLYQDHPEYIALVAAIIVIDATAAIPLAKLRLEEKVKKFVIIQFSSIAINILLNVVLLVFFFDKNHPELGVLYILYANLFASLIKPIFTYKDYIGLKLNMDTALIKSMFLYAFPLVIAGFAGIINETMDRVLLKFVSIKSGLSNEAAMFQVGIYSANYKLAMLISIFLQAYRYAAEPFFFKLNKENDQQKVYGNVMNYFVALVLFFFLAVSLNLPILKYFISNSLYWEGLKVVPILLMANVFLGIYFNQSIWYKLSGQTKYGAIIAIIGASLTLIFNFVFIPTYGYMACAWTTMSVYGLQMIISYFWGQKHYPIPYNLPRFFMYLGVGVGLFFFHLLWINQLPIAGTLLLNNLLVISFVLFVFRIEKPFKRMKKSIQ